MQCSFAEMCSREPDVYRVYVDEETFLMRWKKREKKKKKTGGEMRI